MLTLVQGLPDNIIAVSAEGQITAQDYDRVLIPAVDQALARYKDVKLYYEVGQTFTGIDFDAALKDCRVGFNHWRHWKRIAIVTDVRWIKNLAQFFMFLMPAQTKIFSMAQSAEAKVWIAA